MSMPMPLSALPQSPAGFYAMNNQFLVNGPKGFTEVKMLENEDMFVRMDLPGVPEEGVVVSLDLPNKTVTIYGYAPEVHTHDLSDREYITMSTLVCNCCDVSGFTSHMSDGVLRLLISKTFINPQIRHASSWISFLADPSFPEDLRVTDPHDPTLTGPELMPHPYVLEGSDLAYESKQLPNGSLYLRLDMPGVPKDNFTVSVDNGRVMVTGQAPAVGHDSGGRFYSGAVAMLPTDGDIPSSRIRTIIKNGVIRLIIPHI
ncbi:putative 57 kDa heat shock protein [Cardamine amara subsp. amara]|uniref:57 kDa heat shock protein n=1 Tax=Cardamine amara subsp. amara TaxID=228776 RepID=A0ABD1A040_CARAN